MPPLKETPLQAEILRSIGGLPDVRLFRNNVALAWVGEIVSHNGVTVVLRNARPLHAGLCVGSADLIGLRNDGRFLSLEVKTSSGRPSLDQLNWQRIVRQFGGISEIVRSTEEALRAVRL